jgi:hypothetical protein
MLDLVSSWSGAPCMDFLTLKRHKNTCSLSIKSIKINMLSRSCSKYTHATTHTTLFNFISHLNTTTTLATYTLADMCTLQTVHSI